MGVCSEIPLTENRHIHVDTESAQFKANVKNLPPADFMSSVEVVTQLHDIVQKYSPDVDLYALHKLNRHDAV